LTADGSIRVAALSTTPVKGLRIAMPRGVELERSGAHGDRRFYLIDDRGRMINGKHSGALSEIAAALDDNERLTLTFADGARVSAATELGERVETRFFSDPRTARLVRGPFSAALSEHAGEPLRLVCAADGASAIDRGADGAVSLISSASLRRLAEVAGEPRVDARRFRMTIEVEGVEPFAEDQWLGEAVRVGDAVIVPRGHVGRCIVTSRDPESGRVDLPTLDLLRSFRDGLDTTEPLAFGVYGEVLQPGAIALGDRVELDIDGSRLQPRVSTDRDE
jgi:hypothetical protein